MKSKPIENLSLLGRELSVLKAAKINTIEELTSLTETELLNLPRMNRAMVAAIKERLWNDDDLSLRSDTRT